MDYGRDLNKTLDVYTNARGLFINLDQVTECLIDSVILLAARAHGFVKGKHSQKTQTFVKACIAYVHITIPTLESADKQIKYFLLSAQIALLNGLIGETDSLCKAVLANLDENFNPLIGELNKTADILLTLLGFLVVVPSDPERDFFQLANGVINILSKDWSHDQTKMLTVKIYCGLIGFLSSQTQQKLPYRIAYVNSNDQVFIGNQEFLKEANEMLDYCFNQILDIITKLNENKSANLKNLFNICVRTANVLVANGNFSTRSISNISNKMFKMADGYLTEYNATPEGTREPLLRDPINRTFEACRKKKEAAAKLAET